MKISGVIIKSRQNPAIIKYSALKDKKYRDAEGAFLCNGRKLVCEAVLSAYSFEAIFVSENKLSEIIPEIERAAIRADRTVLPDAVPVSVEVLEKLTGEPSPDGVCAVLKKKNTDENAGSKNECRIVLSGIQDPANVGAVLRSALAFGVDRVIMTADCADAFSQKALRASMGAALHLPIYVADKLAEFIKSAKNEGCRVFAAEKRDGALSLSNIDINKNDIFIIGSEGQGVKPEISALCNASVYIPIADKSESLNAAVAASILMFEQKRRCSE